jgi:hypothetical protein
MKSSPRVVVLVALALGAATATVGPASSAEVTAPTASVGEVSCVAEDGAVTVTLGAGDSPQTFVVLLDGSSVGDDPEIPVDAGATKDVDLTGLEDGDHTVEVLLEVTDADDQSLALEDRTVACDVAPQGPYTHVEGAVYDGCEGTGTVSASNKAIAGDTEDLQDVDFEVVFTPTDDTVDGGDGGDGGDSGGGTDPVDGGPDPLGRAATVGVEMLLDSFTLGATAQTYDRTFGPDDLGGTGDLTLRTGDTVVATGHVGLCLVVPVAAEGSGGPALPDTGF